MVSAAGPATPEANQAVPSPRVLNIASRYIDGPIERGDDARIACIHEGETLTYVELQRRVDRAGNALAGLGIDLEQRVALLLPNRPEFPIAFFAAAKIGAVAAPISYAVTPDEQAFLLADSRARAIVTTETLWAPLRSRRREFPQLRHVLLAGPADAHPGEHDFARLCAAAPQRLSAAPTAAEDAAFWLHTSGSTGTPKWAIHLHRDMPCCETLFGAPFVGLRAGDVVVCGSPCFHAYPLAFTTYFAFGAGATVVLNSERATPQRIFELIRRHRATVFAGVPTLYAQMLHAAGDDADLSSLRACFSAAEPLPAELYHRWRERFGVEIFDGLGATETLQTFISNRAGDVRPGSSGRVVPGYRVRLLDEAGAEVPDGEVGDLAVSGASLFAGYWRRPDVTRRALRGEWYLTGDKFRRDADGFYWYMGRADDLLRVSGHWVAPAEVEAALAAHPAVVEAAVVGREDEDGLVKPKAFVVLRDGHAPSEALAAELKAHVKASIAPFKYPRWIEFRAGLPKTATGKIQRYKLREDRSLRQGS
jgi:benzoate-CoA ligase family protein